MNTEQFCEKHLKNYTINPDNTIDVNDDVYLHIGNMEKIPVKFGKVVGSFWCNKNRLTTLDGCPNYVGGNFLCNQNKLTTLEGCPKYVGGRFSCSENELTSLKGVEKCEILGDFHCMNNDILPENYIYIITAKIGGYIFTENIFTNNDEIDKILNTYKNEVKYLHKALSELKKVNK
jgi:hypothetical protein